MKNHRTRKSLIVCLCLLAAIAAFSCTLFQKKAPRVLELPPGTGGGTLAVAASFVSADDDVPTFFKHALADSGVLALQAVIRNGGQRTLLIHSSNGMIIGPDFVGIRLVCGADTFPPLHPGEASAIAAGARRASSYRKPGALDIAGGFIIPPFGIYKLYQEATIGRFYRPLFDRSLFPALQSGLFEPIRLDPGAERRGWLYFGAPTAARGGDCTVLVTACFAHDTLPRRPGYNFRFSHGPWRAGDGDPAAADGEYLFSLVRENKRSGLFCIPARVLIDDPDAPAVRVHTIAAKEASIADAARRGGRVVIGANFRSKSRILEIRCGAAPAVVDERGLSRGIMRVFLMDERTCAVTETGFASLFDEKTRTGAAGGKLTRGFDDAALVGGRLLVFARDKGLLVFNISSRLRFAADERYALGRGTRSVVGMVGGDLAYISRGPSLFGDTLVCIDPATAVERRRGVLAGRVLRASAAEASIVLQLEDGTVLRIVPAPDGVLRAEEAGWLPFAARALLALSEEFIALGADGCFAGGGIRAFRPGARGVVEISSRIQ